MKQTNKKISKLQKELKKLKLQEKKLYLKEKRLNKQLQQEKAKSKYNKRKSQKHIKEVKVIKQQKQTVSVYRYSIAFFNSRYDKTFRAYVYTQNKQNQTVIQNKLISFVMHKVGETNKGLISMFNKSQNLGLEFEEVGLNDRRYTQLNRFYFVIE